MKGISIEERAVKLAHYIIDTKETVRSIAKTYGISKRNTRRKQSRKTYKGRNGN